MLYQGAWATGLMSIQQISLLLGLLRGFGWVATQEICWDWGKVLNLLRCSCSVHQFWGHCPLPHRIRGWDMGYLVGSIGFVAISVTQQTLQALIRPLKHLSGLHVTTPTLPQKCDLALEQTMNSAVKCQLDIVAHHFVCYHSDKRVALAYHIMLSSQCMTR